MVRPAIAADDEPELWLPGTIVREAESGALVAKYVQPGGVELQTLKVKGKVADLDDAVKTVALASSGSGNETRLPFAVDDALLQGSIGEMWAVSVSSSCVSELAPC